MWCLFIIFLILSIYKINFKKVKTIDKDALLQERTTMINGFFVGLIFFSHFNGMINISSNTIDNIYFSIFNKIGQLMVTTFLFYSGYGILESIKNKQGYMKKFFKNRILKLFITFFCAIILYLILNLIFNIDYSIKTILLSFIGFEDIGNSNWFIFATFCMYFIILFSFNIFKNDNIKPIILSTIITIIYIFVIFKIKRSSIWCDTILCFNIGMIVSYYKEKILLFLNDNKNYILLFTLFILSFVLCYLQGHNYVMYNFTSIFFVLLIFLISLKVKVGNKILLFLGKNTFNIYILQRISFILYRELGLANYALLYFIISLLTTLILAILFQKTLNFMYKKLKI